MPTVELRFRALPAHVRTARLVAGVLARKAGVSDELLDEVRLAVGEACSRAVDVHRVRCPAALVQVRLVDDDDHFRVEIRDCGASPGPAELPSGEDPDETALAPHMGLAVIRGLVDDFTMDPGEDGLTVRMSWPAPVAGRVAG